MYLFYIDESGDCGINNSPTKTFVLSSIAVHETKWLDFLNDLIEFRRYLRVKYGLGLRNEIHASEFINGNAKLRSEIKRNDRLDLLKKCLHWLANRSDISIITVRCLKGQRPDVFEKTWKTLIQRLDNTLAHNNFPGGYPDAKGIILPDNTDGGKLTRLLREMRRYNPIPNSVAHGYGYRNIQLRSIIEDPVMRDSANSYFHQMTDLVCYFARQHYEPNSYVRKKGAATFYGILEPVINTKGTRSSTPFKIVEI